MFTMTKCSNGNLQKNIYCKNTTDGQETKSLGMEQGVRKSHGRTKPALKHGGAGCEEEQGTPLQSMKNSGTPSFSGGSMQGGSKDCTGRTSTAAGYKESMPQLPPPSGTRSQT